MKIYENIDLGSFAQLVRATLHKIANSNLITIFSNFLTKEGMIGYSTTLKRIVFSDNTRSHILTTVEDIPRVSTTIYYTAIQPESNILNVVKNGDLWVNASQQIKVFDSTLGWINVNTNANATINDFDSGVTYADKAIVIFNEMIYQNRTGILIPAGSFNTSLWTAISTKILSLLVEIPAIFANNTTIGIVTRTNNNYTITHNFNSTIILARAWVGATTETYMIDYETQTANTVVVKFSKEQDKQLFVRLVKF